MLRLLASLARRLASGVAAIGRYGILGSASVVDILLASVADAWARRHASDDEVDVEAMVDQRVASVVADLAAAREARVRRREFSEAVTREPADLPTPLHLPPSRSALPDVIDPRNDPQRYACLQGLRHTTRVMFGTGAAPAPDWSVLNSAQRGRLERLTTPALAAPVQRELLRRLGWESVDGWWWPHRATAPTVPGLARAGGGGGPAFRVR